jgi:hypothetical protein
LELVWLQKSFAFLLLLQARFESENNWILKWDKLPTVEINLNFWNSYKISRDLYNFEYWVCSSMIVAWFCRFWWIEVILWIKEVQISQNVKFCMKKNGKKI